MKKITLSIFALISGLFMTAQENLVADTSASFSNSTINSMAECSQSYAENFNFATTAQLAFDVEFNEGESFELQTLTFQYLTIDDSEISNIDLGVYSSINDLPGNEFYF